MEPSRPRPEERVDCKRSRTDEPQREQDYRNSKPRQENTSRRDNPRPYCMFHEHRGGHNTRECPTINAYKEASRSAGTPCKRPVLHAAPAIWPVKPY